MLKGKDQVMATHLASKDESGKPRHVKVDKASDLAATLSDLAEIKTQTAKLSVKLGSDVQKINLLDFRDPIKNTYAVPEILLNNNNNNALEVKLEIEITTNHGEKVHKSGILDIQP
jgi:hypothetical protein